MSSGPLLKPKAKTEGDVITPQVEYVQQVPIPTQPTEKTFYSEWRVQIWSTLMLVGGMAMGNFDRSNVIFDRMNLATKTYVDNTYVKLNTDIRNDIRNVMTLAEDCQKQCSSDNVLVNARITKLEELLKGAERRLEEVKKLAETKDVEKPTTTPSVAPTDDDIRIKVD